MNASGETGLKLQPGGCWPAAARVLFRSHPNSNGATNCRKHDFYAPAHLAISDAERGPAKIKLTVAIAAVSTSSSAVVLRARYGTDHSFGLDEAINQT